MSQNMPLQSVDSWGPGIGFNSYLQYLNVTFVLSEAVIDSTTMDVVLVNAYTLNVLVYMHV